MSHTFEHTVLLFVYCVRATHGCVVWICTARKFRAFAPASRFRAFAAKLRKNFFTICASFKPLALDQLTARALRAHTTQAESTGLQSTVVRSTEVVNGRDTYRSTENQLLTRVAIALPPSRRPALNQRSDFAHLTQLKHFACPTWFRAFAPKATRFRLLLNQGATMYFALPGMLYCKSSPKKSTPRVQ